MIRKTNKIMALALVTTIFTTVAPMKIANNISVKAETSSTSESALEIVEEAMLTTKLNIVYSGVKTTDTVSEFEQCGTLSYTLGETTAAAIAVILENNSSAISQGVTNVYKYGATLISAGYTQKGQALETAAATVASELETLSGLSTSELISEIQTEATSIPVYKYTVVRGSSTVAQGFAVGGILGLALNPSDTYNATEKTATYSSSAVIPALSLSGSSTYDKTIDLTSSGVSVICDGLNINVVDSTNDKVYAINNPVYKMLKSSSTDTLNVIDFSGVTNLKGFTSTIDFSAQGISTKILGISLTTSDSESKSYKYVLPVGTYEKNLLDSYIDSMNLGTVGTTLEGMIVANTYVMIPDINTELESLLTSVSDTVDNVTDALDDFSDSLDDLTDALTDTSDDVDNAWDKVADRFDNDPGWGKKDGYVYYYDKDGVSLKGVQKIDGKTYYFNRIDGAMETGWQIVDGKKCYFSKKKGYEVFTQWIKDGDDYYFVGNDGNVKKMEWINYKGEEYYLKADGKMTKDWLKIDDYWYYFNKDGSMAVSSWKWSNNKWFYLKDNGEAATGWLQLGVNYYYFKDPSGEMQTGWFRADGNWYCTNDDGSMKTGWAESKDGWCYLDDATGIMKKNEWATIDGKSYYFNINGVMVTGSRYIDGTKYIFNSDGTLS